MKRVLLVFAVVIVTVGLAFYYYFQPKHRTIATYIDGTWNHGDFRGCILIPPVRKQLYCGVQAKGPWSQVLSDKEHIKLTKVSFIGQPEVVFWRCQKDSDNIECKDAGVKTEVH